MPMHVTKGRVAAVMTVVAAVWLAVSAFRPDAVEVEAELVRLGAVREAIAAEAITRVRQRYTVAAPVNGQLERIELLEGMAVRGGEPVARIAPAGLDPSTAMQARARHAAAVAQRRSAESRIRAADAATLQAMRDRERAASLHAAGAMPLRSLEAAELEVRARREDANAARAMLATASAQVDEAAAALAGQDDGRPLAQLVVRAPATGVILRIPDRSARVVPAGTPIMEIGETRQLEVVADVLSSDAARILPGMRVVLSGLGSGESFDGQVRLVEPAATTRVSALGVDEQRVDVIVDVSRAPAAAGDGFRIDADIILTERPSTVTVSPAALVRTGDEWSVFLVDGGRAHVRKVRTGALSDTAVEILDGVAPGDRVIVFPSDQVRDGVRVKVR